MAKHWYVVQVFRGKEEVFIDRLRQFTEYSVFTPKQVQLFKRKDRVIKFLKPMFPGYIFIATDSDYQEFREFYQQYIAIIDGCIKVLKYKDEVEALYPQERKFIERFVSKDSIIDSSFGFIEGERIRIIEGPLVGNESLIKKINRHKRTALIEIAMFGGIQSIELSCEIMAKTDEVI